MREAKKRFDREIKCPYCMRLDYRKHSVFEFICNHCSKRFANKKINF